MKRIRVALDKKHTKKEHCSYQSIDQFIEYYLPPSYEYEIVKEGEDYDIFIANVQTVHGMDKKKINILISVENMDKWPWYKHREKYGDYGDDAIDIYIYNHKSKIEITDKYITVPTIHSYINYYTRHHEEIHKLINNVPFRKKKFMLTINRSNLNKEIPDHADKIKKLFPKEKIDNIELYTKQIKDVSCYHTIELLNVLSQYKFVLCMENSYLDGYITEKIFNCFFANTIPLYKGAFNVHTYINGDSFIDLRSKQWNKRLAILNSIEVRYTQMIASTKTSPKYNDENYKDVITSAIDKKLYKS